MRIMRTRLGDCMMSRGVMRIQIRVDATSVEIKVQTDC